MSVPLLSVVDGDDLKDFHRFSALGDVVEWSVSTSDVEAVDLLAINDEALLIASPTYRGGIVGEFLDVVFANSFTLLVVMANERRQMVSRTPTMARRRSS